jgi:hypothetical protein
MKKPIHKFNGGRGATLCNRCRVIITVGLTDDLYCQKCINMTAVDFLLRELRIEDLAKSEQLSVVIEICKEAKEMEKEQIRKAMNFALDEDGHTGDWKIKFIEKYIDNL